MTFTKTISFNYVEFPQNASIMLTFDDPEPSKLGAEQAPLAWKVIEISKNQSGSSPVVFTSQLAFGKTSLAIGNIVEANTYKAVNPGQSVTLVPNPDANLHGAVFDPAVDDAALKQLVACKNKSGTKQTVSVGFMNGNNYEPTYVWKDVGGDEAVKARYRPVLKAYATRDFKQGQFLSGDITSTEPIWKRDLSELTQFTYWVVSVDANGKYSVVETPH